MQVLKKIKNELERILTETNNDKEIVELAKVELDELIQKHKENENKLKLFLLPKDEADAKNAILEIRAGTGVLRQVYLLQTYLRCMKKFVIKKNGQLKL